MSFGVTQIQVWIPSLIFITQEPVEELIIMSFGFLIWSPIRDELGHPDGASGKEPAC